MPIQYSCWYFPPDKLVCWTIAVLRLKFQFQQTVSLEDMEKLVPDFPPTGLLPHNIFMLTWKQSSTYKKFVMGLMVLNLMFLMHDIYSFFIWCFVSRIYSKKRPERSRYDLLNGLVECSIENQEIKQLIRACTKKNPRETVCLQLGDTDSRHC